MPRLLASCLAVGLTLLFSRVAEARPSVELTTSVGGAEAAEYLVRVANPEATDERGVLELRRMGEAHAVARAPFEVPAHATKYFRIPAEKGQRLEAFAITSRETISGQDHFRGDNTAFVVFDIPPLDELRLHELRVHAASTVVTHATFDETTRTPVLTRRAAVYDGVSLVLVPSHVFLGLPAAEREAITTWVRTGGALGLSISEARDLERLSDLIGAGVKPDAQTAWSGGRLRATKFAATADVGLGYVHLLPVTPWSAEANGEASLQENLVELASRHRGATRFSSGPWPDVTPASLDPNQGYRSVMAIAGVLLVLQALITAFAFRRLALKRGMGPAYRLVAGSSAVTFAAVVGLGIYAKGGFGARARELSFAEAASGESVAWVERNRTYFASNARTIEVTPRDASNLLTSRDSHAMLRTDDKSADVILGNVGIRPWQTTAVTERGTTTLGGGVRVEYADGKIIVRNATGSTLRNVLVSSPEGGCHSYGDIADGQEKASGTPRSCTDLGPSWSIYDSHTTYGTSLERFLVAPHRLTLVAQLEEGPASVDGFRLEKRTTLLRVVGGAS